MGKKNQYPSRDGETQAHNISSRQKENRGGTAGEVGEGEGAAEEGCLEPAAPAASTRCPFFEPKS
jgi:hypothetical protein